MKISIDPKKIIGTYEDPTVYQNNTLRYSPPADFPAFLSANLGRARIMRSFITLDEYWDFKTDTFFPDYAIGVKRYPDNERHYIYDWKMIVPAPSGIRFEQYLKSHAAEADELMLNVRRYEREVSDGIISYDKYEEIFERAVEYCKELAPNIRYIECCNEVDIKTFGDLTALEYFKIYERAHRAVHRLNEKHNYSVPLLIGAWGVAHPFRCRGRWEEFLRLLSESELSPSPIDFYSEHHYEQICAEGLAREGSDPEAAALCAVDKLKLLYKRHKENIARLGLPEAPFFLDEVGVTRASGVPSDSLKNACGMLTYLMAASEPELCGFHIFPWCTFHNPELQISYTQFTLNGDGTYSATPNGMAVLMLHKPSGDRVLCSVGECDAPDARYRAMAVKNDGELCVIAANTSEAYEELSLEIASCGGKYNIRQYLCDSSHNNSVTGYGDGRLAVSAEYVVEAACGRLTLTLGAEANAFMLLRITEI